MSRHSRAAIAAIAGLLFGLGTLTAVVLLTRGASDDGSGSGNVAATGAVGDTGSLAPVETSPSPTTRSIEVGGFPNAVAVGAGSVWVVRDGRRLIRIDPKTGTIAARIGAGDELGSERPCGVAVGKDAVWVTTVSGKVARISPETNRVSRQIDVAGAACIAAGGRAVWVTSPDRGVVTRIDAATSQITAEIPIPGFPEGIVTGFGSIWVASSDPPDGTNGGVSRINARTNAIAATIPVPHLPQYLATTPSGIWVSGNDGSIRRIDPDANQVAGPSIPVATGGATTLAAGEQAVWGAAIDSGQGNGLVQQVNASTGEILGDPVPVGKSPAGWRTGTGLSGSPTTTAARSRWFYQAEVRPARQVQHLRIDDRSRPSAGEDRGDVLGGPNL